MMVINISSHLKLVESTQKGILKVVQYYSLIIGTRTKTDINPAYVFKYSQNDY